MAKVMTYTEAINIALEGLENAEARERLEALKVQLAKRGSGKHGPTKAQKENVEHKAKIAEVLANGGLTATEVGHELGFACQKATALLKQMVEAGEVVRIKEGRVVRFELA